MELLNSRRVSIYKKKIQVIMSINGNSNVNSVY